MNKRLNIEGYSPMMNEGKDWVRVNFSTIMSMEEFRAFSKLLYQGTVDADLK